MRKVLYILGELNDSDIEWMIEVGDRRQLTPPSMLIREGRTAEALFIVLKGRLVVQTPDGQTVATPGRGEVLGEMSLIEAHPPTVRVVVQEDSSVLAIPRHQLEKRLEETPGFSGRFYRAIAMFLSHRLRDTTASLGYGTPTGDTDELDENVLENVYLAGTRFEAMMKRLVEG